MDIKPVKKVLLVGYIGGINIGDEAIAGAVAKELLFNKRQVIIASGQPEVSRAYLGEQYEYIKSVYPGKVIDAKSLIKLIKTISQVDSVIYVGGGILQDVHSINLMRHCYYISLIALIFKIPTYAFGIGLGPIKSKEGEIFVNSFIKTVQRATFRDAESINLMQQLAPKYAYKCDLGADSIFLLKEQLSSNIGTKNGRVGLAFRQWKELDFNLIYQLVEELLKLHKQPVFFAYEASDLKLYERLQNDFSGKLELSNELTFERSLDSISNLEGLVSMRLHANLFAIMSNVPFVALSYDNKIVNVISGLGYSHSVLPLGVTAHKVLSCLTEWQQTKNSTDLLNKASEINLEKIENFINCDRDEFEFLDRASSFRALTSLTYEIYFLLKIQNIAMFISGFIGAIIPSKVKAYIKSKLKLNW